jgi:DNA-binding response OmpR family regulator
MRRLASIRYVIHHAGQARLYAPLRVLVYSSDADIRMRVRLALGRLPDNDAAPLDFVETATQPAVIHQMVSGGIDLAILDAEAAPSGGIGLAKQLKDELLQYPPIVVLTARPDDAWLAAWSGADAVMSRALDPIVLRELVVPLLRSRIIR